MQIKLTHKHAPCAAQTSVLQSLKKVFWETSIFYCFLMMPLLVRSNVQPGGFFFFFLCGWKQQSRKIIICAFTCGFYTCFSILLPLKLLITSNIWAFLWCFEIYWSWMSEWGPLFDIQSKKTRPKNRKHANTFRGNKSEDESNTMEKKTEALN